MSAAEMMTRPKVALLYYRISSDRDGDELGVQRQQRSLHEYVLARGWEVGREFTDNDQSAFRGRRREGYQALLRAVEAGDGDVVVCTEVSRLTRHPRELEELVDLVERTGVEIAALRAGQVDLSTSGGRAVARILGVMSRLESEQMGERISAKHAQNARAGKSHGGPRPYGFRRVGPGQLELVPEEADVLRDIAERALAGEAMRSLARDLNERGIPTVRGGYWRDKAVRDMLFSPRIAGLVPSKGDPVAEATWEPLLPRADWERLRARLTATKVGRRPRSFLLSGFVWCGQCGERMYSKVKGTPERPRKAYHCRTNESGTACAAVHIEAGPLEAYIAGVIVETASRANLARVRAERSVSDVARLTHEIADDESLLAELAADLGARRISRAEWVAARVGIDERLHANRAALATRATGDQLPDDLTTLTEESWEALTFDQKRSLIALFIDRIHVDPIGSGRGNWMHRDRVRISWKQ